jgi:hypothetical protein
MCRSRRVPQLTYSLDDRRTELPKFQVLSDVGTRPRGVARRVLSTCARTLVASSARHMRAARLRRKLPPCATGPGGDAIVSLDVEIINVAIWYARLTL